MGSQRGVRQGVSGDGSIRLRSEPSETPLERKVGMTPMNNDITHRLDSRPSVIGGTVALLNKMRP